MKKVTLLILIAVFAFSVTVTAQQPLPEGYQPATMYVPEVLNAYPHDSDAFTQGLLWYDGFLYESTGMRGESSLRQVELTTGEVIRSVDVRRSSEEMQSDNPPQEYFAEGLELVNGQLIQLTWQSGDAFVYDFESFERLDTINYFGEGWGLCYDGRYLYMSDSTQYISIREADTFDLIGRMLVTINGQPLQPQLLNELECVGESIYANLWQTDFIVEIDKYSGNIIGVIDASTLLTDEERAELHAGAVLNGIAYNPDSETFYITGKDWSQLFEVSFVPASDNE